VYVVEIKGSNLDEVSMPLAQLPRYSTIIFIIYYTIIIIFSKLFLNIISTPTIPRNILVDLFLGLFYPYPRCQDYYSCLYY